jgi:phage gp36-like protein
MTLLIKEPGETLRHQMLFGGVSTIQSVTSVTVTSRGLIPGSTALIVAQQLFAKALTLVISGGTHGEHYDISASVIDDDGQPRTTALELLALDQGWLTPDGHVPLLSIGEFIQRVGLDEVIRMTDARGDGRLDKDRLVSALTDAQATVEAHCAGRYALPIDPVPVFLKTVLADLARARLYSGEAPEGIAGAARAATRTLERIQSGQMSLPGVASADAGGSEAPIVFKSGGRAYPDNLADY